MAGEKDNQMIRTARFLAIAVVVVFVASFAQALEPQATDLTKLFHDGGITNDHLQVVEIGGIVVIRGRTNDMQRAEDAGRFAQSHGYTRVANLIQLYTPVNDAVIQRKAERELSIHRALDGCAFRIASRDGVVELSGRVSHELQKDVAVELVRNIDGVRSVQADGLQR